MQKEKNIFSNITDEELMLHICAGEVGAFDEIYKRYAKRLLGYFIRMLNYDKCLAEDALQDVFVKLAEFPEKFDGSRQFKTWIFSIASNQCKNIYRHKCVVAECQNELGYLFSCSESNSFTAIASKIDACEFRTLLDEALKSLPRERKEAFILRFQEDKSISEIAHIQNCPEGSVKSRLHYTIKILEEKLQMFNPVI
jgi:RNA polymerase sigma-70 factor (ECF subfamily)